jgi:hypothetical protein
MTETTIINYNLFILQEDSKNAKNITKVLIEENLMKSFTFKRCNNSDLYLSIFNEYLLKIKSTLPNENEFIGFLSDKNIPNTLPNTKITTLKSVPENCDILFLQYIANKLYYDKDNTNENWTRVDVINSYHFAINSKSIDKILEISNKSKTWTEFIKNLNKLQCYGVTQEQYSYIEDDTNYKDTNYKDTNYKDTNVTKIGNVFDLKCSKLTDTQKYKMLPNISLLCILTDIDRFIHTLHTFLKLDYPRDKLELIVVDDKKTDLNEKFKSLIPNDKRISFINLNPEDVDDNYKLPLGYKINTGVKYCKYDIIFHLFDTNVYYIDNFTNLIKTFIMCNKDLLLSKDTGLYYENKDYNTASHKVNNSDIGNMLYLKKYWSHCNFTNYIDDTNILLYKFTSLRQNCNVYTSFVYWSFKNGDNSYSDSNLLKTNLKKLIPKSIIESYELSLKKNINI